MAKENNPLLTDEFLDELVKQINQQYGDPTAEALTNNEQQA